MRLLLPALGLVLTATIAAATWALVGGSQASDPKAFIGDQQLAVYRPDPRTIWRYRPGASLVYTAPEFRMNVQLNEEGWRDTSPSSTGNPLTVLVVGDSFTFGWGVQEGERFSTLLGRQLARMTQQNTVRIVNVGVASFAFDQQLLVLSELVKRLRPAVVVQGFYWMHIRSLSSHREQRSANGHLEAISDSTVMIDDRGVLRQRWDANKNTGDWVSYLREDPQNEDLWQRTERLLAESMEVVADAKAAYVPFLIPTNIEVGGTNWASLGWAGSTPPLNVDIERPRARIAKIFGRRGLDIIDLAPQFRSPLDASSTWYYPQDGHWTPAGHAVAAEILAPHVLESIR